MNRTLRYALLASVVSFTAFTARATEPGHVDLGAFAPTEGCEFVEVNLHQPLLKFASLFVEAHEPEAAAIIRNLKHVRVNVVGFNDATRGDTTERVKAMRHDLTKKGWMQVVSVKEAEKTEDVAVFVLMNSEDAVEGVVVTVLDAKGSQAVLVNVVGSIKPEEIAALGKNLNLPGLSQLELGSTRKGV